MLGSYRRSHISKNSRNLESLQLHYAPSSAFDSLWPLIGYVNYLSSHHLPLQKKQNSQHKSTIQIWIFNRKNVLLTFCIHSKKHDLFESSAYRFFCLQFVLLRRRNRESFLPNVFVELLRDPWYLLRWSTRRNWKFSKTIESPLATSLRTVKREVMFHSCFPCICWPRFCNCEIFANRNSWILFTGVIERFSLKHLISITISSQTHVKTTYSHLSYATHPNWRDGNKLLVHFSMSLIGTSNRGEITPHLLRRPVKLTTTLPERWSSTISNSPI